MLGTTKGNQHPPSLNPLCECGCGNRVKRSENKYFSAACQWVKRPKPTLFRVKLKINGKYTERLVNSERFSKLRLAEWELAVRRASKGRGPNAQRRLAELLASRPDTESSQSKPLSE